MNPPFKSLAIVITSAITMLASSSALAWTQKMDIIWPMGENDSRSRARELALDALRIKASNAVGKIVESAETLRDGTLSEEIKTVGVSMVKIDDVRDTVKVEPGGRISLALSANVTIDDSELSRRATAMREDIVKTKNIRRLADENADLRQQLADLRNRGTTKANRSQAFDLQKRENDILDLIQKNDQAVTNTFAAGSLITLAAQDGDSWEREKARLDAEVFGELLRSPVQVSLVGVEQEGEKFVAKVQVGWRPNFDVLKRTLSRNFNDVYLHNYLRPRNERSQLIDITDFSNSGTRLKSNYTIRAWDFLSKYSVWVQIDLGTKSVKLPLFYQTKSGAFTGCEDGVVDGAERIILSSGRFCLILQDFNDSAVKGLFREEPNPIRIPLTRQQAATATDVKAVLVRVNNQEEWDKQERVLQMERNNYRSRRAY